MNSSTKQYFCPCCGYRTLDEKPPGTFNICEICFWEDDEVQFRNPEYEGGANGQSLQQYQQNFLARDPSINPSWGRQVCETDERDPLWKPIIF